MPRLQRPSVRKSFREISVRSSRHARVFHGRRVPPGLENTAYFQPDQSTYSNGTAIAEVEVDVDTGRTRPREPRLALRLFLEARVRKEVLRLDKGRCPFSISCTDLTTRKAT